jgi:predicted nucleic acid-binding protein
VFANRYTALVDACSLAGTLNRNFLLTLAEAEFFRLRWSSQILDETQRAVEKIMTARAVSDGAERALRSRQKMETAFPEAMVEDYAVHMPLGQKLPDLGDAHVLAAAVRTQAQTIVTENLKDFPSAVLLPLNLEARTADTFIADTIALDEGRAIQAIKQMRLRLRLPEKTADALLRDCEAHGLLATATVLRPFIESI